MEAFVDRYVAHPFVLYTCLVYIVIVELLSAVLSLYPSIIYNYSTVAAEFDFLPKQRIKYHIMKNSTREVKQSK